MADRRGRKRVLYEHGATATAQFALPVLLCYINKIIVVTVQVLTTRS